MVVSNIYITIGYFLHERIWDKIKWGKLIYKKDGEQGGKGVEQLRYN